MWEGIVSLLTVANVIAICTNVLAYRYMTGREELADARGRYFDTVRENTEEEREGLRTAREALGDLRNAEARQARERVDLRQENMDLKMAEDTLKARIAAQDVALAELGRAVGE